ncbi:MAG: Stp1/IreP family PP2C-type Ser/Thr phosphatase [Lachnospiraceae bacterium]|nr:Stp1/IreP family PP2C-type Ser/Thr phosphatase [Lachnospiraceae bacterium]
MKVCSITDVGRQREVNQDYVFCKSEPIGNLPNLFIVADGMGGHKAGDHASRTCVSCVVESIEKSALVTPVSALEEAIKYANTKIYEESVSNSAFEGMGTTFVGTVVCENRMFVANIGDSRLYIIKGDTITQVTEDHSLVEAMIRNGELERKNAKFHPNKNIITRALGTGKEVIADYFEVNIDEGDVILMCSDGLSNMMDDEEMLKLIQKHGEDINTAGGKLVEKANANGGKDNISLILIQI